MHFEAGFVNFLRTLIIIIGVFYLFRWIMKLVAPWLMRKTADRMRKNMQNQSRQQSSRDGRKEGDVTIEYEDRKRQDSNENHRVGDYVDFEEVDNK